MADKSVLETVREDDFVEYFIFPQLNSNENEEIVLNNYLTKINNAIRNQTKDYLWHKDEFNVTTRPKTSHLLNEDFDKRGKYYIHQFMYKCSY